MRSGSFVAARPNSDGREWPFTIIRIAKPTPTAVALNVLLSGSR